jgi:DNA repair exonuclease SbcCD ATPase subunit
MKLKLENFMTHDDTELELPGGGIILVHGLNGAGKSAFAEAMAYCLWGKMLRGDTPWRDDGSPGVVEFHVKQPDLKVVRRWTGKQQKLSFTHDGNTETYETRTKCQTALETIIGPFDLWRRACVFSLSDAASFSTATDADRKRMLEKLLGLEWFDVALKQARSDYKDAQLELEKLTTRVESLKERKVDLTEQVEFYATQLEGMTTPEDSTAAEKKLQKYQRLRKDAKKEVNSNSSQIQRKQIEFHKCQQSVETLKSQLEALEGQTCHTCGQPVPVEVRDELQSTVESEMEKLAELRSSTNDWLEEVQEDIEAAQSEVVELEGRIEELSVLVRSSTEQVDAYKKAQRGLKKAKVDLDTVVQGMQLLRESVEKIEPKVIELNACVEVLGLKGVRAHVLGETLGSIEAVANQWLSRLSDGKLQMELRPYSDKGTKDSISLKVKGGNFKRTSGGERRRVDVSILLALSQIGLSTVGAQANWPIVFDEVFDAIDKPGTQRVQDALKELSSTRPTIVITHTHVDELVDLADMVLKVEDGVVRRE